MNNVCVTYKGVSRVERLDNENDVEAVRKQGHFGHAEVGAYALYLGPSDGGFLIIPPDSDDLKGVPPEEINEWRDTHGEPELEN